LTLNLWNASILTLGGKPTPEVGLSHDGAYWENLYTSRARELQNRFDDGRMYESARECTYMLNEEQMTFENALAIWAKWTVLHRDFKITKD